MGGIRSTCGGKECIRDFVRRPEGRRPGVHGMIILKRIFKQWDGAWTELRLLWRGTGGSLL
jgi:hypothetical protein